MITIASFVLFSVFVTTVGYLLSLWMTVADFNVFILLITSVNYKYWGKLALNIENNDDINASIGYDKKKFLLLLLLEGSEIWKK